MTVTSLTVQVLLGAQLAYVRSQAALEARRTPVSESGGRGSSTRFKPRAGSSSDPSAYDVPNGFGGGTGAAISRVELGFLGFWSRLRLAIDELRSGQLTLSELPARVSGNPRAGMRALPEDEDMQEML